MLLSVVIATYNRRDMLRRCLEALSRQDPHPHEMEVVVVVDGSTDGSAEMLHELLTPYQLRVELQSNRGQAAALNRGIEIATGRFCLFLDDDIIVGPGLVAAHVDAQRRHDGVVGLGYLGRDLPPRSNGLARYLKHWSDKHYAHLRRGDRPLLFIDCFSGNMSAPRAALDQVGGFAVDLPRGYDLELGYRLQKHGLPLLYIPEAVAHQDYRKDSRAIISDAENAGEAGGAIYTKHPATLPHMTLGMFSECGTPEILLDRCLLALDVPVSPLAAVGARLPRRHWRHRWYRFLFRYCYWRGVKRTVDGETWRRLTRGTPILRYHAIGALTEKPRRHVVPVRRFRRQMALLRHRGYSVLSLEDLLYYRDRHVLPPDNSVVVTFDDGYQDNRALAYPILRHHHFKATIFLVTSTIGRVNNWDAEGDLVGRRIMDHADIHDMAAHDIDFGAHSRTHPRLTSLPWERARDEIEGARRDLGAQIGAPATSFAYPYGDRNVASDDLVQQAGFAGAVGIREGLNGPASPQYALRRTEIRGTDSLLRFALVLWLGTRPLSRVGR